VYSPWAGKDGLHLELELGHFAGVGQENGCGRGNYPSRVKNQLTKSFTNHYILTVHGR
jgi:hypothetical protein